MIKFYMSNPTREGARKDAGRKPERLTERVMFSLPTTTVDALAVIPDGERSRFVNEAILKALRRFSAALLIY
jgi:hypothetical protein